MKRTFISIPFQGNEQVQHQQHRPILISILYYNSKSPARSNHHHRHRNLWWMKLSAAVTIATIVLTVMTANTGHRIWALGMTRPPFMPTQIRLYFTSSIRLDRPKVRIITGTSHFKAIRTCQKLTLDPVTPSTLDGGLPLEHFSFVASSEHRGLHQQVPDGSEVSETNKSCLLSSFNQMAPEAVQGPPCFQIFDLLLPEGRCVGIQWEEDLEGAGIILDSETHVAAPNGSHDHFHWTASYLHPDEVAYLAGLASERSRITFILGRIALRLALTMVQASWPYTGQKLKHPHEWPPTLLKDPPILKDEYGRPRMPQSLLGSISHKRFTGAAIVQEGNPINNNKTNANHNDNWVNRSAPDPDSPTRGVGVDIEFASSRRAVAKFVLTENERKELGNLTTVSDDEEVLLRFSLKESLYKAMHPLICQYVGFQEVEVHPLNDGSATVRFNLTTGAHDQFDRVTAHWRRVGPFFLTSSSVELKKELHHTPRDTCSVKNKTI